MPFVLYWRNSSFSSTLNNACVWLRLGNLLVSPIILEYPSVPRSTVSLTVLAPSIHFSTWTFGFLEKKGVRS